MPEELAGKLEQDRRTFQMKTVEVYLMWLFDVLVQYVLHTLVFSLMEKRAI